MLFYLYQKLAYLLPFSLETSRYALVAKAFHCKTTFSATPEFDNSLVAEKQGRFKISNKIGVADFNASFFKTRLFIAISYFVAK